MPTIKAETLGWTPYTVMLADGNGAEANDGFLSVSEASAHVAALEAEQARRNQAGAAPSSMLEVGLELHEARKLELDLKAAAEYSSQVQVQYIPDALVNLPLNLRKRATELLINDDLERTGEIDKYVVEHARDRYESIVPISNGAFTMKDKALAEIAQIANFLGVE